MSFLIVAQLFIIFFLGIVTSYGDIRYGKIKNKWISIGLVSGIVFSGILLFQNKILINDFYEFLISFLLVFVVMFLMWKFKKLGAGDAKLFLVFLLLIFPIIYQKDKFSFSLPLNLSINIFGSVIFYIFFYCLYFSFKKNILKKILKINWRIYFKKFIMSIVSIFMFSIIFILIKNNFSINNLIFNANSLLLNIFLLAFFFTFLELILDIYRLIFEKKKFIFAPWIFLGVIITILSLSPN